MISLKLSVNLYLQIVIFLLFSNNVLSLESEIKYDKWLSFHAIYDDVDYFNASTEHMGEQGEITFFVSKKVKECHLWEMSLTVLTDAQALRAFETTILSGRIRVDENPIHKANYYIWFDKGDDAFYMEISDVGEEDLLIEEIKQGGRLRIEVGINERQFIIGFPLSGANDALERAELLCQNFKPDKEYFGEIKRQASKDQFEI